MHYPSTMQHLQAIYQCMDNIRDILNEECNVHYLLRPWSPNCKWSKLYFSSLQPLYHISIVALPVRHVEEHIMHVTPIVQWKNCYPWRLCRVGNAAN